MVVVRQAQTACNCAHDYDVGNNFRNVHGEHNWNRPTRVTGPSPDKVKRPKDCWVAEPRVGRRLHTLPKKRLIRRLIREPE